MVRESSWAPKPACSVRCWINSGGRFTEGLAAEGQYGFSEIYVPSIWETETWTNQSGAEIEGQMWAFRDKGDRDVTLIPEVTAMLRQEYRERWAKAMPKPVRVFYAQRCYRYERPQEGRYREFTQFGLEIMGPGDYEQEARETLQYALACTGAQFQFDGDVKRGLSYYSRQGFEARCPELGAQQQVAGGGSYAEGCGWAVGVDRLVLALQKQGATA